MRFPVFAPPRRVKPRPQVAPAFLRPWVPVLARLILGLYLRLLGYRGLQITGADAASRLWADFYAGKNRLIVAFRHALGNDPQLMAATVLRGVRVRGRRPFVQFVHGVEVGWWAGALARFILPRSGGLPVDHDAVGTAAFDRIRQAIVSGAHPVALAPEGQVTYESRTVQRVQAGFARLGFLAAEDLAAQGREEPVLVVPVSFHHAYPEGTARRVEKAIGLLETEVFGDPTSGNPAARLLALREGLFQRAEAWYVEHHRHEAGSGPWNRERAQPLFETALTAGEDALGLAHEGEYFSRLYRLRSTAWARYFPDRGTWDRMTGLDRGLAARAQAAAWTAFRHLELADLGWYLWSLDPVEDSSEDFLADFVENLYDLRNRLTGGNISHRRALFPRSVRAVFGAPLNLSARLGDYRAHKKETVADVVAELVKEWNRG